MAVQRALPNQTVKRIGRRAGNPAFARDALPLPNSITVAPPGRLRRRGIKPDAGEDGGAIVLYYILAQQIGI
jgi:hypothetical protein